MATVVEMQRWIASNTRTDLSKGMMPALKDGRVLCKLANKVEPGSIGRINKLKTAYHSMENISNFLKWAESVGVQDLFNVDDLQWGQDPNAVIKTLTQLYTIIQARDEGGYRSPAPQDSSPDSPTTLKTTKKKIKKKSKDGETSESAEKREKRERRAARKAEKAKREGVKEKDTTMSSDERRARRAARRKEKEAAAASSSVKESSSADRKARREARKAKSGGGSKLQQFLEEGENTIDIIKKAKELPDTKRKDKESRAARREERRRKKEKVKEEAVSANDIPPIPSEPPGTPPETPPTASKFRSKPPKIDESVGKESKLNSFLDSVPPDTPDTAMMSKPRAPRRGKPSKKHLIGKLQQQASVDVDEPASPPSSPPAAAKTPEPTFESSNPRKNLADFIKKNPPKMKSERVEDEIDEIDDEPPSSPPPPTSKLNAFAKAVGEKTPSEPSVEMQQVAAAVVSPPPPVERKNSFKTFLKNTFTPPKPDSQPSPSVGNKFMAFMSGNSSGPSTEVESPAASSTPVNKFQQFLTGTSAETAVKTPDPEAPKSKLAAFLGGSSNGDAVPATPTPVATRRAPKTPTPFTPRKHPEKSSGKVVLIKRGTYKTKRKARFSLEDVRVEFLEQQRDIRLDEEEAQEESGDSIKQSLFVPGMKCYVPDPQDVWILAEFDSFNERTQVVTVSVDCDDDDDEPELIDIDLNDPEVIRAIEGPTATKIESLPLAITSEDGSDPNGVEDMRYLQHLNEPSILFNLKDRFLSNHPYTYTNDIVLAINPYQWMEHLYGDKLHKKYLKEPKEKLPPHVYSTSASAYKSMQSSKKDQSILVSGESGAGKTETTKIVMNHLASIAGGRNDTAISRVIDVNPLLESFGNAKTVRNDNSSRFGKFTQMQFDKKNNLIGARCDTYLLEKSRVVSIEEGERNYHVFYQMLSGLANDEIDRLQLDPGVDYAYIGLLQEMEIRGLDDRKNFDKTRHALNTIGLEKSDQSTLFQILAGIIHLGQFDFEKPDGAEEGSQISNYDELQSVSRLFGLPTDHIEQACCTRTVRARNEEYTVPLSPEDASENRNALAKTIYSKLFDWICYRMNEAIGAESKRVKGEIGVLDIFGFEDFKHNGFEQFCINFANEKLQQKFTTDVFKSVEEEYSREGLDWTHIEFSDNTAILQLIEGKMGIIAMMNDHIRQPRATEEALVNKIKTAFKDKADEQIEFPKMKRTQFTIRHYAGAVTYETIGFMEKHKDTLLPDLLSLMQSSSVDMIQELFGLEEPEEEDSSIRRDKSSMLSQQTLGTQFKNSLNKLMENISYTNVHYIRCIKPNTEKRSDRFDQAMVVEQLRSAGVIEAIRISRSGYPSRLDSHEMIDRYSIMFPPSMLRGRDDRKSVMNFMKVLGRKSPKEFQTGKSLIYFKQGVLEELEAMKSDFFYQEASKIQAVAIGFIERVYYQRQLRSIILIQSVIRFWIDRTDFVLQRSSACKIQRCFRGYKGLSYAIPLTRQKKSAKIMQRAVSIFSTKRVPSGSLLASRLKNALPRKATYDDEMKARREEQQRRSANVREQKDKAAKNRAEKERTVRETHARAQRQLEVVPSLQKENLALKAEVESLGSELEKLRIECRSLKNGLESHRAQESSRRPPKGTGSIAPLMHDDDDASEYSDSESVRSGSFSGSEYSRSSGGSYTGSDRSSSCTGSLSGSDRGSMESDGFI